MSELVKALRAAVAFDSIDWREKRYRTMGLEMQSDHTVRELKEHIFELGMCEQRERFKPILSRLIAVVEAADTHVERCEFSGNSLESLDDALADLRAAVMPEGK